MSNQHNLIEAAIAVAEENAKSGKDNGTDTVVQFKHRPAYSESAISGTIRVTYNQ